MQSYLFVRNPRPVLIKTVNGQHANPAWVKVDGRLR